jgi:hypothetical protein
MSTFWTEAALEPKRNFRFKVTIAGFTDNPVIWWAKNFKTPSYDISEATHDFMDNKYYFPGRLTWTDCTMSLVDPASPDATQLTNQIVLNAGYKVKGLTDVAGTDTLKTMSKDKSVNNGTKSVVVTILNAEGATIETWTLQNAWLKGASYSDLSYDNDDLRTIDLTWRYDWAECVNADGTKQFNVTGRG